MLLRALASACLVLALAGTASAAPRGLEGAPESFRTWLEGLPEGQRRMALRRLADMPTQRRNVLFRRWEALEEGERRAFEQRMVERLERGEALREQLTPETRERLAPLVRRWRDMAPADRRRMRERLERFRTLSPEDQEAIVEKRFSAKTPEERKRILEALRAASQALPRHPLLDAPEPPEAAPPPES
jgi:hypothetical protein